MLKIRNVNRRTTAYIAFQDNKQVVLKPLRSMVIPDRTIADIKLKSEGVEVTDTSTSVNQVPPKNKRSRKAPVVKKEEVADGESS